MFIHKQKLNEYIEMYEIIQRLVMNVNAYISSIMIFEKILILS